MLLRLCGTANLDVKLLEVSPGDLLIELLGEHVDTNSPQNESVWVCKDA